MSFGIFAVRPWYCTIYAIYEFMRPAIRNTFPPLV